MLSKATRHVIVLILIAIAFIAVPMFAVANANATQTVEYQAGNLVDLSAGDFSKKTDSKTMLQDGYDFGLGAATSLGEVVDYDGHFYWSYDPAGKAIEIPQNQNLDLTFFTGTAFEQNVTHFFQLPDGALSLSALETTIDQHLQQLYGTDFANNMYAISVTGVFDYVLGRNEDLYKSTSKITVLDWLKSHQHVFIDGAGNDSTGATTGQVALVMFRNPQSLSKINQVPYHVHFVDTTNDIAGHVYQLQSFMPLSVIVQKLDQLVGPE